MDFKGIGRAPYLLSGAKDGSLACVNYHERLNLAPTAFMNGGSNM